MSLSPDRDNPPGCQLIFSGAIPPNGTITTNDFSVPWNFYSFYYVFDENIGGSGGLDQPTSGFEMKLLRLLGPRKEQDIEIDSQTGSNAGIAALLKTFRTGGEGGLYRMTVATFNMLTSTVHCRLYVTGT